jgi:hypothetical protein
MVETFNHGEHGEKTQKRANIASRPLNCVPKEMDLRGGAHPH